MIRIKFTNETCIKIIVSIFLIMKATILDSYGIVCVCVCERERERERGIEWDTLFRSCFIGLQSCSIISRLGGYKMLGKFTEPEFFLIFITKQIDLKILKIFTSQAKLIQITKSKDINYKSEKNVIFSYRKVDPTPFQ